MTTIRKAASVCETESGREEKAAALAGGLSKSSKTKFTILADRPQGPISKYLLYGQRNAVPLQQLVRLSRLDDRTARRLIEGERRAGMPICSDNQTGYYLAADAAELGRFVHSMQHRAAEIWRTARALDDTLQLISGQERMEGF